MITCRKIVINILGFAQLFLSKSSYNTNTFPYIIFHFHLSGHAFIKEAHFGLSLRIVDDFLPYR